MKVCWRFFGDAIQPLLQRGNSLERRQETFIAPAMLDIRGCLPEVSMQILDMQSCERSVSHGPSGPGGDRMTIRQRVAPAGAALLCLKECVAPYQASTQEHFMTDS